MFETFLKVIVIASHFESSTTPFGKNIFFVFLPYMHINVYLEPLKGQTKNERNPKTLPAKMHLNKFHHLKIFIDTYDGHIVEI